MRVRTSYLVSMILCTNLVCKKNIFGKFGFLEYFFLCVIFFDSELPEKSLKTTNSLRNDQNATKIRCAFQVIKNITHKKKYSRKPNFPKIVFLHTKFVHKLMLTKYEVLTRIQLRDFCVQRELHFSKMGTFTDVPVFG